MRYGYARVSTKEQNISGQTAKLRQAGCEDIFIDDGASGVTIAKRPALVRLLKKLKPGDSLTVCALDRLARSMKDLQTMMLEFQQGRVQFRSLKEDINTSTATGRLMFHVFAALAEFEHDLIVERTRAGMARPGAKRPGRKPKMTQEKLSEARRMLADGDTRAKAARVLSVDRKTLYIALLKDPKRKL